MSRYRIRLHAAAALALTLLFATLTGLCAQESPPPAALIGAGASIGRTSIKASIPFYGFDRSCGEWTEGSATPIGGAFVLRLPTLVVGHLGATLRLGITSQTGELVGTPVDPQRQLDPTTGTLVDVRRELRLESSLSAIHLDALAGFSIGGFSIWAGPTLQYRYEVEQSVTDVILAPSFAAFRDGSREASIPIAPELTDSEIGVGAAADIAYTLGVGPKLYISPHLGVRIEPTSPYQGFEWSQVTLGAGLDVLFDAIPTPRPVVIAPVPQPRPIETRREPVRPTVEVTLRALDTNGAPTGEPAEVIYREVIERRHVPLIPAVFFDSASAALPARLHRYSVDAKPADVASTLAELTTMQAQTHLLNVLGERLRANPRLQLTLVGSWSGEEDRAMGRARAEAVRGYLVEVWRLDPAQIAIGEDRRSIRLSSETDAEGRQENRRVEIVAAATDLLRPVFVERQVEQAIVPLALRIDARASLPARGWVISLGDGATRLALVDSAVAGGSREFVRAFVIEPERLTTQSHAVQTTATATFDSLTTASGRATIPLQWRREQTFIEGGTERTADRESTTWQVLGFAFNSSELLERHREEVRTIGGLVRDGARVIVTGYSDRLGDQKRNLELSRERAERVAAALRDELARRGRGDVAIEAIGAGVDETRFSNDLPEGRFLSRGATITVEQPVR